MEMLLHTKSTSPLSPSDFMFSAFESHTNPVGSVVQASTFCFASHHFRHSHIHPLANIDAFNWSNKLPAADHLSEARPLYPTPLKLKERPIGLRASRCDESQCWPLPELDHLQPIQASRSCLRNPANSHDEGKEKEIRKGRRLQR